MADRSPVYIQRSEIHTEAAVPLSRRRLTRPRWNVAEAACVQGTGGDTATPRGGGKRCWRGPPLSSRVLVTRAHVMGLEVQSTLGLFMFFNQMSSEKTTYPGGKGWTSGHMEVDGLNLSQILTHLVGDAFYLDLLVNSAGCRLQYFERSPQSLDTTLQGEPSLLIFFNPNKCEAYRLTERNQAKQSKAKHTKKRAHSKTTP